MDSRNLKTVELQRANSSNIEINESLICQRFTLHVQFSNYFMIKCRLLHWKKITARCYETLNFGIIPAIVLKASTKPALSLKIQTLRFSKAGTLLFKPGFYKIVRGS